MISRIQLTGPICWVDGIIGIRVPNNQLRKSSSAATRVLRYYSEGFYYFPLKVGDLSYQQN